MAMCHLIKLLDCVLVNNNDVCHILSQNWKRIKLKGIKMDK